MTDTAVHVHVTYVAHHISFYLALHRQEVEKYNTDFADWSARFYKVQAYLNKRKLRKLMQYPYSYPYLTTRWDYEYQYLFSTSKPIAPASVKWFGTLKKLQELCKAAPNGTLVLNNEDAAALLVAKEEYSGK